MNNQNLYLVGTVHLDLEGKERLDTLLDRLSPSVIALEFHKDREDMQSLKKSPEEEQKEINEIIDEFGLVFNPRQRATLIESENRIKDVRGYEFKSSRDYVQRNPGSRLEYIDISVFENGKEEFVKGYVEAIKEMLKQIAEEPEIAKPFLERLNGGVDAYLEFSREYINDIYQNADWVIELIEMIRSPKTLRRMKRKRIISPQTFQTLKQIYNPARDEAMGKRIGELYDGKNRLVVVTGLGHLQGLKTKVEDLEPRVMTLAEYDSV